MPLFLSYYYVFTFCFPPINGSFVASYACWWFMGMKDSDKGTPTSQTSANSSEEKENCHEEPDKLEQEISEKSENNIVTSIAEKAMSVAGPVVPVKEDGEVDQDRSNQLFRFTLFPFPKLTHLSQTHSPGWWHCWLDWDNRVACWSCLVKLLCFGVVYGVLWVWLIGLSYFCVLLKGLCCRGKLRDECRIYYVFPMHLVY